MIAELICVGTELLMGQVVNTNAAFLSRELAALGITQQHQQVVGDNAERLEAAYRLALSRADVVITSGGLGPTVDDITKRVAARVAGKELVLRPEAEAMVRERFSQYHRIMRPNNLSQAMFTPDSTVLLNPYGTAPAAIVPVGADQVIIHLPGPPRELQPLFVEQVRPYLAARSGRTLVSRYIRIFGMGESEVDSRLRDQEEGHNPSLSPYCSTGEVMLRATASAGTKEACEALLAPLVERVRQELGDVIYEIREDDGGSLALSALKALRDGGLTVCAAETGLTCGRLCAALSEADAGRGTVAGGVVCQSPAALAALGLTAEAQAADLRGRAAALASCARERLHTDLAVSAVWADESAADPNPRAQREVLIGLAGHGEVRVLPLQLSGDPGRVRELTVKHALDALRRAALSLRDTVR